VVEQRQRIGDIEVDLMIGSDHKSALLVMTDRTTLVTMLEKLSGKEASEFYEKMERRLTNFSSSWVKTLTFDNGKEFAQHQKTGKILKAKNLFHKTLHLSGQGNCREQDRSHQKIFSQENRFKKSTEQTNKRS